MNPGVNCLYTGECLGKAHADSANLIPIYSLRLDRRDPSPKVRTGPTNLGAMQRNIPYELRIAQENVSELSMQPRGLYHLVFPRLVHTFFYSTPIARCKKFIEASCTVLDPSRSPLRRTNFKHRSIQSRTYLHLELSVLPFTARGSSHWIDGL
jgi:hypothetical protein